MDIVIFFVKNKNLKIKQLQDLISWHENHISTRKSLIIKVFQR